MIEELRTAGFVLASRMILLRGARGIPYRLYLAPAAHHTGALLVTRAPST